jgi:hypothetical protein
VANLALAFWALAFPRSFGKDIADFGAYQRHLVIDVGTAFAAIGAAQLALPSGSW